MHPRLQETARECGLDEEQIIRLGPAAQEAAVPGSTTTQEAFELLLRAISRWTPPLYLDIDVNQACRDYSRALRRQAQRRGRRRPAVTGNFYSRQMKRRAFLNAILEQGCRDRSRPRPCHHN